MSVANRIRAIRNAFNHDLQSMTQKTPGVGVTGAANVVANVVVLGATGAGKSTLLNALLGEAGLNLTTNPNL